MEYSAENFVNKIMETVQEQRKGLKTFNVMILGKTGVGKSTLINRLFNEKVARTGRGKPVTNHIAQFTKADFPLAVYDTPGLELKGDNSVDNLLEQVDKVISCGVKSGEIGNAVHCVLYCVSATSNRFEDAEKDFLKRFLETTGNNYNVPVIIVLTQSYVKKQYQEMKQKIEDEKMPVAAIIPVLAEDMEIDDVGVKYSFGMDELAEIMNDVIPEAIQKTFISIQSTNLELKEKKARAIVAASAATAAAIGLTPIPFSDAALLVPEQVVMLAGITTAFGLPIEKSTITMLVSATIGPVGTTVLGKAFVSGMLKLIPGVGTLIGGGISAAAAAALTAALGEAYIHLLICVSKGELLMSEITGERGRRMITEIFQRQLKLKRNKKGEVIR